MLVCTTLEGGGMERPLYGCIIYTDTYMYDSLYAYACSFVLMRLTQVGRGDWRGDGNSGVTSIV